jgi:hypothetical protein
MNYCPSAIPFILCRGLIWNVNEAGEFYLAMVTHGCLLGTVAFV